MWVLCCWQLWRNRADKTIYTPKNLFRKCVQTKHFGCSEFFSTHMIKSFSENIASKKPSSILFLFWRQSTLEPTLKLTFICDIDSYNLLRWHSTKFNAATTVRIAEFNVKKPNFLNNGKSERLKNGQFRRWLIINWTNTIDESPL